MYIPDNDGRVILESRNTILYNFIPLLPVHRVINTGPLPPEVMYVNREDGSVPTHNFRIDGTAYFFRQEN